MLANQRGTSLPFSSLLGKNGTAPGFKPYSGALKIERPLPNGDSMGPSGAHAAVTVFGVTLRGEPGNVKNGRERGLSGVTGARARARIDLGVAKVERGVRLTDGKKYEALGLSFEAGVKMLAPVESGDTGVEV